MLSEVRDTVMWSGISLRESEFESALKATTFLHSTLCDSCLVHSSVYI